MLARQILVAALVASVLPAGAQAQTRRASLVPAEAPPAEFSDAQYVDSRGCVFVRAGSNGQTTWFPRFGDDRQPLCGYEPSLGGAARLPGGQAARPEPVAAAEPEAPVAEPVATPSVDFAATPELAQPRATLTVRRQLGTVLDVPPPDAPLTVVEQRGTIHDPQAEPTPAPVARQRARAVVVPVAAQPERAPAAATAPQPEGEGEWVVWDGSSPAPRGGNRIWVPRATPAAAPTPVQVAPAPVVVTRARPPAPAPVVDQPVRQGGRFVQVGAYAVPSNADRTQSRLREQGLPVATDRLRSGGRELQLVMAGPFASAEDAQAALGAARRLGYRDAYLR